jgi:spoIIIJ-associated protein
VRAVRGVGAREARVRVSLKPPRRGGGAVVTPEMADALLAEDPGPDGADYGAGGEAPLTPDDYTEDSAEEGDAGAEGEYDEEYYGDEADTDDYEEETDGAGALGMAPPIGALSVLFGPETSVEQYAAEALRAILAHMGLGNILIEVRELEPLTLNVQSAEGDDLSVLIGRRGETLTALQLLVALIVSKQGGERHRIVVDVEGYRERREENLRSLARRVAEQVRRSRDAMTLEAMPPNERRIIHMELSEDEDLSTDSIGEGEQRRIVIALRRPQTSPPPPARQPLEEP